MRNKLSILHQTLIARYYNDNLTENEKAITNKIIEEVGEILASTKSNQVSEVREVTDEYKQIVQDLADWSLKYPRGKVYPMRNVTMDNELIDIEERAKKLISPK